MVPCAYGTPDGTLMEVLWYPSTSTGWILPCKKSFESVKAFLIAINCKHIAM